MIKTTVRELDNNKQLLAELLEQPLPGLLAYRLAKISSIIEAEMAAYTETKNGLIKQYGEDKGNGMIVVPPKRQEKYFAEINPIMDQEVTIEQKRLSLQELVDAADDRGFDIKPIALVRLGFMFDDDVGASDDEDLG